MNPATGEKYYFRGEVRGVIADAGFDDRTEVVVRMLTGIPDGKMKRNIMRIDLRAMSVGTNREKGSEILVTRRDAPYPAIGEPIFVLGTVSSVSENCATIRFPEECWLSAPGMDFRKKHIPSPEEVDRVLADWHVVSGYVIDGHVIADVMEGVTGRAPNAQDLKKMIDRLRESGDIEDIQEHIRGRILDFVRDTTRHSEIFTM